MPTVIDSLIVELGLDPKNFTEGQKKAVESFKKTKDAVSSGAKDIEQSQRKAGEAFGYVRNQAIGLFAALIGGAGAVEVVKNLTNALAAMKFQAANVGQSVPEFAAMSRVIEQNGGSAQAAAASFFNLSQALEGARAGYYPLSRELATGLSLIGGQLTDGPLAILDKFNAYAQKVPRQQGILVGSKFLGLDQGTLNEALKPRAEFLRDFAEQYKRGLPSQSDVDKFKKLQEAVIGLSQSLKQAAIDGGALSETLIDIVQGIEALMNALKKYGGYIPGVAALHYLTGKDEEIRKGKAGFLSRMYRSIFGGPSEESPQTSPDQSIRTDTTAGRRAYALDYLTRNGVAPHVARGVVAGMEAEDAGLDPNAVNQTSGALGIYQALGSRKKALTDKYGAHPTFQQELDQLLFELKGGDKGGPAVLGADTDAEAMRRMITGFERPGDGTNGDLGRGYAALASMAASRAGDSNTANDNRAYSRSTRIDQVHVHTQATDGPGIARSLRDDVLVDQANNGVQ